MKDPNTAVAINNLRAEVGDMFKSMNKSIDARINNVVEQVINKSLDFHTTTKKKALEDITVNAPLSVDQLTQLYRQLFNDINDIKSNTTNYALYDQMQVIGKQFEEMRNKGKSTDEIHKAFAALGYQPANSFAELGDQRWYSQPVTNEMKIAAAKAAESAPKKYAPKSSRSRRNSSSNRSVVNSSLNL